MTAKNEKTRWPLVGVASDTMIEDGLVFHKTAGKYLRPVAEISRAIPVMIPALGPLSAPAELLERLDGVLLTGALSNVHPESYGRDATVDAEPFDAARDDTTLALLRLALDNGVPLLAICRGVQELNVALGGDLICEVQRQQGRFDHRSPESEDLDIRYGARHKVTIRPDGALHRILGRSEIEVNSLHRQAIGTLAPGLTIEATADDGTIEGISVDGARAFALGVQWHPEYKARQNPDSVALFEAFGAALRQSQEDRRT